MKILLILGLCGVALSTSLVDDSKKRKHCHWQTKKMAIGDVLKPKYACIQIACKRQEKGTSAIIQSCGVITPDPGYRLVKTTGVPYPDCCPKTVPLTESETSEKKAPKRSKMKVPNRPRKKVRKKSKKKVQNRKQKKSKKKSQKKKK